MEQFTPAKLGGKEMMGLSTAGKESEGESPAPAKNKAIFKERTKGKGSGLGVKLNYFHSR